MAQRTNLSWIFPVLFLCFFILIYTSGFFKRISVHPDYATSNAQKYMENQKPPTFDARFKNPCWYNGSRFHCLPYVFFLGIRKSGTTDLNAAVRIHPQIVTNTKGTIHWFSWNRFDVSEKKIVGFNSYLAKWDRKAPIILQSPFTTNDSKPYQKIFFTRTPSPIFWNKYWPMLPGNEGLDEPRYVALDYMKHIVPTAKAFVNLRNPIERTGDTFCLLDGRIHSVISGTVQEKVKEQLYSDYKYAGNKRRPCTNIYYLPSEADFHSKVVRSIQMYRDCFKIQPIRACLYNETLSCITGLQLRLSITVEYVKEALRVFGRDDFFIVSFERYVQNKTSEMAKLFDFLGIRHFTPAEEALVLQMSTQNSAASHGIHLGPMLQETRQLLENFFAPFNEQLTKLLEENFYQYEV